MCHKFSNIVLLILMECYLPLAICKTEMLPTRLCPDLFGVGKDKQEFLVFDLCGNFDFFNQQLPEASQQVLEPLTAQIVKARIELTQLINNEVVEDPEQTELRNTLLDDLHQHVATMEKENFLVRRHQRTVEEFSNRERWEQLSEDDREAIAQSLAFLPNDLQSENRLAKEFDLLCLKIQLSILKRTNNFINLRDKVRDILSPLEGKKDIPMIKEQLPLIQEVQAEDWWTDVTRMALS